MAQGNTVSASGWIDAMEKVWRSPLALHRIRLNRGDIGFGQEPIMAWHEQGKGKRPSFLFKLKLTSNVTNLTPEEADAFQIVQLYRQRADAEWSGATWTGAKRRREALPGSVRRRQ